MVEYTCPKTFLQKVNKQFLKFKQIEQVSGKNLNRYTIIVVVYKYIMVFIKYLDIQVRSDLDKYCT